MNDTLAGVNIEKLTDGFMNDLFGAVEGHILEQAAKAGETEVIDLPEEMPGDLREGMFHLMDNSPMPEAAINAILDLVWGWVTEQAHDGAYAEGSWDPADYLPTPAGSAYDEIFVGLTKIEEQARHLGDQAHALLRLDDALEPPERDRLAHAVEAWCGTIGSIANNAASEIQTVTEDVR